MNIAIMGAGISGLSCAITLEEYGIKPTIFEKRACVGDRFINGEAMFGLLNRPIKNSLKYLKDNYEINLTPIDTLKKLLVHSKSQVGTIDSVIGYSNIRGRHQNSYERQLENQISSKINFNSNYDYAQLCKEFEYVILATGDGEYSTKLGNYRSDLTCTIKGATIVGKFDTSVVHAWFNYNIIPKGYAWLVPYSEKEANLVLAYPDYPNNIKLDINDIWNRFYDTACKDLDQNFKISDRFEITRYMLGICDKPVIDNTYFVGNCFGTISPGLGFGQFTSVLTGVYSALDLCKLGNYEKLSKPLFENYNNSLIFRRFLENLTDDKIDRIIKSLDNKLLDNIINKVTSEHSDLELLKYVTPIMELYNSFKS